MSYTTLALVWFGSGLLSFPLLLRIARQQGAELGTDAAGIVAGLVILFICALLGMVTLIFSIAIPLIPKRPLLVGPVDSDEQAIIHMLVERAKVDDSVKPHPVEWLMVDLWMTEEAALLHSVDGLLWRADAEGRDLSDEDLFSSLADNGSLPETHADTCSGLLARQVKIAAAWTRKTMKREKQENYPRPESWVQAVSKQELHELGSSLIHDGHPCRSWCDWRKLKGRMLPGDSVLRYDSPHRAGVVLTRGLRAIAHVNLEWRCYH